jgi:hypothetical protein
MIDNELFSAAFGQAKTAIDEMLQLWHDELDPFKRAKLTEWHAAGVRLAVLVEPAAVQIMLVNSKGRLQRLDRLDIVPGGLPQ